MSSTRRASGIEHSSSSRRNKAVIEDHFDIAYELEKPCKSRKLKEWQA